MRWWELLLCLGYNKLMKKNKLLTFLLLLAMSFQVVHAFAIDALDTHSCEVSEYVVEFSQPISDDITGDICNIHSEFHNTFLVPEQILIAQKVNFSQKPSTKLLSYEYTSYDKTVKPPINL